MAVPKNQGAALSRNERVEAGVPKHGGAHVDRGRNLEQQIQKAATNRNNANTAVKPEQKATNLPPALKGKPAIGDVGKMLKAGG
jgi:hypothetical protein